MSIVTIKSIILIVIVINVIMLNEIIMAPIGLD